jgi:hypothetical protein
MREALPNPVQIQLLMLQPAKPVQEKGPRGKLYKMAKGGNNI